MGDSDLVAFHASLMHEVATAATARGDFTRTALCEALVGRLIEAEELPEWTPCFWDGRGSRGRAIALDGYCAEELDLDGTLHVVIADHRDGDGVESLTSTDVKAAYARAVAFVEDALAGRLHDALEPSTPAADFASRIFASRSAIRAVKILVVSNATLGPRFREVRRTALGTLKVELHVWDLSRFQQIAASSGREEVDIDVTQFLRCGMPALPAGIGKAGYRAYLCVVPGAFLADIYEEYGSRLLEGNVRAFLSTRGKVNKGIRRTIAKAPDRFFAFNNGITATAVDIEQDSSGAITRIRDLQIVNGGQTTASLYNARARDAISLADVFVQMKLSVLSDELAQTMIPEISEYANTQNKVSDADLFANHPFHRRMEEVSRRLWAPPRQGARYGTHWFYERARAQYQTEQARLSAAEKRTFLLQNPKDQVITKTDLAKFENTWRLLPHVVSLGAQKSFVKFAEMIREEYDRSPLSFNERWYQHLVAKAILFHAAERMVSAAPWYANAYRANIVTYGVARTLTLVQREWPGYVIDLDQLWRQQSVPEALLAQLERAAEVALRVLMAPPADWSNVTEWAKKELCWQKVQDAPVDVVPSLQKVLRAADEEHDERRRARSDAHETEKINAVVEVVNRAKAGFWGRALDWPQTINVVSDVDYAILSTAVRKGLAFSPSDAQARRLIDVAKRLEEEGFE